ncbi:HalOD1 output domain-containing protein [Halobium salinum]|uniref:HalOD1 output domain-containing protein n=1 Tax=Halobium salinum TaxID=1364940 RepID=A0ABD5P808_9EURY|nr:HalOD1 output domain-containing protein [Halobium salinum]
MLEYRHTIDGKDEATAPHTTDTTDDPDGTADPVTSPSRLVYRADDDQALSTAVAFAVAEFREVDPVALAGDTVLGRTVDLGALDDLQSRSADETEWSFEFTLPEERVTVESNGRIVVASD